VHEKGLWVEFGDSLFEPVEPEPRPILDRSWPRVGRLGRPLSAFSEGSAVTQNRPIESNPGGLEQMPTVQRYEHWGAQVH
jgi:hypothetical protein